VKAVQGFLIGPALAGGLVGVAHSSKGSACGTQLLSARPCWATWGSSMDPGLPQVSRCCPPLQRRRARGPATCCIAWTLTRILHVTYMFHATHRIRTTVLVTRPCSYSMLHSGARSSGIPIATPPGDLQRLQSSFHPVVPGALKIYTYQARRLDVFTGVAGVPSSSTS